MERWKLGWMVLALLICSLLGGIVSAQLTPGKSVTIMKAQEFRVVDKEDHTRATLSLSPNGDAVLRLYDHNGKIIWQAPSPVRLMPLEKY